VRTTLYLSQKSHKTPKKPLKSSIRSKTQQIIKNPKQNQETIEETLVSVNQGVLPSGVASFVANKVFL
jgi:hypothetical protein